MTGTREIEGSYSYLKHERCYVFWFVKQGQPIFEGQIVGVLLTDKQERQVISSPRDGYITKLYFKEGERVDYKSRGNHALFDYISLPDAVSKGFVDPELPDNFLWEICAPYDSLAHIDKHKRICFSRDGSKDNSTDTAIDISKFKTVSWAEPIYKGDRFVRVGQPIIKVMHQYHSNRFAKELKRIEDEQRLKDAVEILKDKEKGLIKQIDAIKREYSQREAERDKAIRATQDAEKTVASAEAKALEIVRSAEKEGRITAAEIVKRLEDEAESRKSSILETARQRRLEATELKKAAELEAAQTIETANIQAQDILAAAQSETDAKRRIFSENAAKMNAGAIVSWLYELKERGELPDLMDRPAMRRLYIALGEMLAEAQGYAAPETLAQMENQNRMDEIKAMNYALAKQIRDAEADDFLPDVVRQRMIEQLLDMTEAKGGSIVKRRWMMVEGGGLFLGETDGGDVTLSAKDRRNHIHVIGASNKGKSKFMENLIRADLLNPSVGDCVIDPHGLLVDDILLWVSHLAPHLAKRIVVFEPAADTEFVTGFNPIPRSYDSLSATVYGIIDSILYAWGQGGEVFPRLRPQLYNVLNPLLANKLTLVEALAMFSPHHKKERELLVDRISDPSIRAAWEVLSRVSNTEEYRLLEGVINRFSALLNSEYMRRVLSVEDSSIDMGQIMAEKKILLVSLRSHDRIHSDNLRMLGTMMLTEIYRVGMLRNEHDQPPPFHVYIDEFGQYTTPVVAKALDEIRKKSVYLTVAHQHLAQLLKDDTGTELLSSIMTNCLVRVAFGGLTPQDADIVTRRMWTPHIDLKEVKHRQFATKERKILETQTSVTKGRAVADGKSHTDSQTETWNDGYADGTSSSETHTHTEGASQSQSRTDTKGRATGETWSDNETKSQTVGGALSKGSSRAHGTNSSTSTTEGTSDTSGEAKTESSSRSNSSGTSVSASSSSGESQYSLGEGLTTSEVQNTGSSDSSSSSEAQGESRTDSTSNTKSESRTTGSGSSQTDTKSFNETKSYSDTDGTGSSRGGSQTQNASQSQGIAEGTSQSDAHACSKGTTHTESHTEGGSRGTSDGSSHTETTSESETTSPFYRIEEYKEETSRTFYSVPEQFHRKMGALMALEQGKALFQFDAAEPTELKTKRLDDVPMLKYGRARKLERCRQRMIEANARYFTTPHEIEKAAIVRQLKAFEKPLA